MSEPLRIIELRADNVKRLRTATIRPNAAGVTEFCGPNGAGKTSALDAIWYALGGADAMPERPIRDGADEMRITLDLGDLIVERFAKWSYPDTEGSEEQEPRKLTTRLEVRTRDGAKYGKPQDVLDKLVGDLSFDPLEFARASKKQQVEMLLRVAPIDVDLDALARERQAIFDRRRDVGRDCDRAKHAYEAAPAAPDGTPDEPVSMAALAERIREAQNMKAANDAARSEAERLRKMLDERASDRTRKVVQINSLEERLATLTKQLDEAKAELEQFDRFTETKAKLDVERAEEEAAALIDPDLDAISREAATIEQTNANVAVKQRKAELFGESEQLAAKYANLSGAIDDIDAKKRDAIASAKFPVDGLGFDDSGVTYRGVPLDQASDAEQLRVSLAIAMAANPRLRMIRARDGSLLDSKSLALVDELAREKGYQILVERVDESGTVGIVFENGEVVPAREAVPA